MRMARTHELCACGQATCTPHTLRAASGGRSKPATPVTVFRAIDTGRALRRVGVHYSYFDAGSRRHSVNHAGQPVARSGTEPALSTQRDVAQNIKKIKVNHDA